MTDWDETFGGFYPRKAYGKNPKNWNGLAYKPDRCAYERLDTKKRVFRQCNGVRAKDSIFCGKHRKMLSYEG